MTKHNVTVTLTYDIELEFDPSLDEEKTVQEFSEYMFKVDDFDDLIKFTAQQVARGDDFVEGIGRAEYDYGQEFKDGLVIKVKTELNDIEAEIHG